MTTTTTTMIVHRSTKLLRKNQMLKEIDVDVCSTYKKVRLKWKNKFGRGVSYRFSQICKLILCVVWLNCCVKSVLCNRPPRFVTDGYSEIVLRLKEGPDTPVGSVIYRLKGIDLDGDQLEFGVRKGYDSDVVRVENHDNEATIYLNKELDRETKDEYTIILTLTDHNLGDGNFVTQSLLLLVLDINDNEPIFKPFQPALEVPENSRPGILTTIEATDRDEGAYGQVIYYLQELDGDNDIFAVTTNGGKGVIKLVGSLDYERKNLYQLRVLAVDRANQGRVNTGTAALLVKIKDIEDQPPEFVTVPPVTRIAEDVPIGSKVLQVKAVDGDRGINNQIVYAFLRGDNPLFSIDKQTGIVYTRQDLDREASTNQMNGAFILDIIATEVSQKIPAPSVTTEVTIIVTDVNDETPMFRESLYECEVNENAQENTPVTFIGPTKNEVYDYDQGNNGTFELFIEPPNDIFEVTPNRSVNEATFLIRVKNSAALDFELVSEMNFTLIANEIVPNGRMSSVPIIIHIRDRNDNYPEFSEMQYEVFVPENSGVGTQVAKVEAFDADSGNYGTSGIRFTNLGGGISHLLYLNPVTGLISIKTPGGSAFDRELISKHYLTVEARDNLGKGNRNTVQLIIHIQDVNDNAPVFFQNKYEVKLLENNMEFETALIVEATDSDLNGTLNSILRYDIEEGEFKNNFTINPTTGILMPTSVLDFELITAGGRSNIKPINLMVRARDSGLPQLSTKVNVTIYIQDVNDHPPIFAQPFYAITIPEDVTGGSFVINVKATDRDGSAPNNMVVYRIQRGAADKFVIGADTGVISVAPGASLDPDLTEPRMLTYSLTVIALDGGIGDKQLTAITTVNITIADVNNKPPAFIEPGNIVVTENTPVGTYVYRLIATDPDAKPMLRYSIDPTTSEARSEEGVLVKPSEYEYLHAFELNSVDGIVRVQKLIDREKVELIRLGVLVEDVAAVRGNQTASATLIIHVADVNDNKPRFKAPFYKRSVPENSPHGVTIVHVIATDLDKNKTVTYSLEGPKEITSLVNLDNETGEIVVANKIDHELHHWLNFTVRSTDSGVPPRSSLVDVYVKVIDENDNNPFFIGDQTNITVSENAPVGTRVAVIKATDADSDDFGKITFLMDRISSLGKFSIDADTGVLSVAGVIDREIKENYMLVIEAWDNYQYGYLSGESRNTFRQVFIHILDVNDSPPQLQMPSGCVQITEYHDLKEVITNFKGTDADDSKLPNGQLVFHISAGNGRDLFKIVQTNPWTGNVIAKRPLNGNYGNYTLEITARDLGFPSNTVTANLEICVSDFNDHPPFFISPVQNTTIRVPENATIGSEIVQVIATDQDVGANAAVRYRLKQDPMGHYQTFAIGQETGWIVLKQPLDRERQKIYEIRVEAYDQGIPTPLSSDLDITVYVKNVNDYEPQFLVEEIFVNFTEHKKPGVERRKLPDTIDRDEVDDLDDPPSSVCYFIVYGNADSQFYLDPHTHVLTVIKELDRENRSFHPLIVKATEDCLHPPNNLTVGQPEALANMMISSLLEPKPRGNVDYRFKKTIKSGEHPLDRFKHSRTLRSVSTGEAFYGTTNDSHFDAVSGFFDEDSTLVRVVVYVDDINDNPPKFVSKIFTGGVTTATDFGTTFMAVKAIDLDNEINGHISYYLIGDIQRTLTEGLDRIQKEPFLVDRETGEIQLNFDPQKGMKGYFDFMVLANDTDGLQDTAHVFIYLLREDQKVRFVLRQHPAEVRERVHEFRDTLANVTSAIVNVDEFKLHENKDGSVDKTKTDVYLHLVNRRDNSIFDVVEVLKLIDQNIETLDPLFKEYNVLDTQPAEAQPLIADIGKNYMIVWLIFINIFSVTLLIIILATCVTQRLTFKRELRAARISTFGSTHSDLTSRGVSARVPNTNKHSIEGSNPIWMKAYENEWFKSDESLSHRSGPDSLDENVLTAEEFASDDRKQRDEFETAFSRQFNGYNVYQQIDKLTNNAHILTKKLETTEL